MNKRTKNVPPVLTHEMVERYVGIVQEKCRPILAKSRLYTKGNLLTSSEGAVKAIDNLHKTLSRMGAGGVEDLLQAMLIYEGDTSLLLEFFCPIAFKELQENGSFDAQKASAEARERVEYISNAMHDLFNMDWFDKNPAHRPVDDSFLVLFKEISQDYKNPETGALQKMTVSNSLEVMQNPSVAYMKKVLVEVAQRILSSSDSDLDEELALSLRNQNPLMAVKKAYL